MSSYINNPFATGNMPLMYSLSLQRRVTQWSAVEDMNSCINLYAYSTEETFPSLLVVVSGVMNKLPISPGFVLIVRLKSTRALIAYDILCCVLISSAHSSPTNVNTSVNVMIVPMQCVVHDTLTTISNKETILPEFLWTREEMLCVQNTDHYQYLGNIFQEFLKWSLPNF